MCIFIIRQTKLYRFCMFGLFLLLLLLLIIQSFGRFLQLSIWNCCQPFSSFPYKCQLLCFLATYFKYCSRGLPTAFFPDVAPSRMFTTNSLCLIVCPIHEWHLFFKILKSNLSSFALWKTSSYLILSVHFIFNIILQHLVSNSFTTLSLFFPRVPVSDP